MSFCVRSSALVLVCASLGLAAAFAVGRGARFRVWGRRASRVEEPTDHRESRIKGFLSPTRGSGVLLFFRVLPLEAWGRSHYSDGFCGLWDKAETLVLWLRGLGGLTM